MKKTEAASCVHGYPVLVCNTLGSISGQLKTTGIFLLTERLPSITYFAFKKTKTRRDMIFH